jgi:hypothetical protein
MDIVEKLRATEMRETGQELGGIPITKLTQINPDGPEAADEIELLRKERDGLREAIQKILDGIYIAKHYADEALKEKG